jgi:hypothetical protein
VSTTPALFAGLLDDAAMFPPGDATPGDALRAHLGYRAGALSGLIGPLLVPAARFGEFCEAFADAGSPALAVSLIGTAELPGAVPPAMELVGFELPVGAPPLPDPGGTYRVACEVTTSSDRLQVLAAVAEGRARGRQVIAKYRTGGTSADAFPSERALGEVLVEAAAVGVPLKFTAGLHSAVRFTDPATGFDHHGFLNLMTAVSAAISGAEAAAVESALASRDADAIAAEVSAWTSGEVADVRAAFVSFGCCGVEEPVADLVKLGLLDAESL